MDAAKVAGFGGGLIIDDPESKRNKKYYLVLTAGVSERTVNLQGAEMDAPEAKRKMNKKMMKKLETRKDFISRKKDIMRRRGKVVANDSKFTARKRRPRF